MDTRGQPEDVNRNKSTAKAEMNLRGSRPETVPTWLSLKILPIKSGSETKGDLSQETQDLVSVQQHFLLSPGTQQSTVRYF